MPGILIRVLLYVPCCIYNVRIFEGLYSKWLSKAFYYMATHIV
jgi:hypothetical protein